MDISTKYLKFCGKNKVLQRNWIPTIGDYAYRSHIVFGEEIDEQIWEKEDMGEIIILTYESDAEGWFHAIDHKTGKNRLFNDKKEIDKETCIWLPKIDQIQQLMFGDDFDVDCMKQFVNWVDWQWTVNGKTPHSWEWLWLNYYYEKLTDEIK